jgi:hypothetical protein
VAVLIMGILETVDAAADVQPQPVPSPSHVSAPSPHAIAYVVPAALPYDDCTGATSLDRANVYRDQCASGIYLVAHNPGPFTAIISLKVGSTVSYRGQAYTITSVTVRSRQAQWANAQAHPAALTLQTCANASGTMVWVFTAS